MSSRRRRLAVSVLAVALAAGACGGEDEHVPPLIDARPDAPIDASIDASAFCATCSASEICVQVFNGTCGQISLACETRHANCVGNGCSAGCMQWQCNDGADPPFFRCDVGGCAGVVPGALACYGP